MKKSGILLRAGFVAFAAIALNSVAYSQGAEVKPGKSVSNTQVTPASNAMRGSNVSAEDSKLMVNEKNQSQAIVSNNPERNCASKSTMKPYSIKRKDFNNLPANTKQFILDNSSKYTIVD